jgi:hypothetical protein
MAISPPSQATLDLSTFSSAGRPANPSPSLESVSAWMIRAATLPLSMSAWLSALAPAGSSGKMCPASSPAPPDETLLTFWVSSPEGPSKCRGGDGAVPASLREVLHPTGSRGACLTLNISEWTATLVPSHSDGDVSSLLDILETGDVPRRYFLSPKACRGILRRAEKRGKELPHATAPSLTASGRGVSRTGETRGQDPVVAFGGNNTTGDIDVATAVNAHGGPTGRMEFESETFVVQPTTATLDASYGRLHGVSNQDANHGYSLLVAVPETAATLTRGADSAGKGGYAGRRQEDDHNLVAMPYTLAVRGRGDGHDLEYRQDGTANAVLTPSGGRAGIGVGAVAIPFDTTQVTSPSNGSNPQDGDPMHALSAQAHPPAIAGAAVRRLMPHECARLQGFADDRCRIPWKGQAG